MPDKKPPIITVRSYEIIDLIFSDVLFKILCTLGIEVVREHRAAFLGSWYRERTYTGKYICNNFSLLEQLHEPLMLCI